jgi:predicted metal-dependent phosphotriesterase family hydrolase
MRTELQNTELRFGYARIPSRIARYLRQQGFDEEDLEWLMVRNPARLFAYLG